MGGGESERDKEEEVEIALIHGESEWETGRKDDEEE